MPYVTVSTRKVAKINFIQKKKKIRLQVENRETRKDLKTNINTSVRTMHNMDTNTEKLASGCQVKELNSQTLSTEITDCHQYTYHALTFSHTEEIIHFHGQNNSEKLKLFPLKCDTNEGC